MDYWVLLYRVFLAIQGGIDFYWVSTPLPALRQHHHPQQQQQQQQQNGRRLNRLLIGRTRPTRLPIRNPVNNSVHRGKSSEAQRLKQNNSSRNQFDERTTTKTKNSVTRRGIERRPTSSGAQKGATKRITVDWSALIRLTGSDVSVQWKDLRRPYRVVLGFSCRLLLLRCLPSFTGFLFGLIGSIGTFTIGLSSFW